MSRRFFVEKGRKLANKFLMTSDITILNVRSLKYLLEDRIKKMLYI